MTESDRESSFASRRCATYWADFVLIVPTIAVVSEGRIALSTARPGVSVSGGYATTTLIFSPASSARSEAA